MVEQMATELTDEELQEKLRKQRQELGFPTVQGPLVQLQEPLQATMSDAAMTIAERVLSMWTPDCTSCGSPLDYTAPDGRYYIGRALCLGCQRNALGDRLEASGISFLEIAEPLDGLISSGHEFDRYMTFLRAFAAIKPGQRLVPPFAFVCGQNGVGKSAGAQRALRDAIRNGCQGRFIRLGTMLDQIYATYGTGEESAAERMRFFSTVHLLVIDEVGTSDDPTEHAMRRFFEIVDERWRNSMPTIFTSNYEPASDSLGAHMTERTNDSTRMLGVLDRIRGGAGGNVFVIRGKSWRGHALSGASQTKL